MARLYGVYRFKNQIDMLSNPDIVYWSPQFHGGTELWSYMAYKKESDNSISLYYCDDPDNPVATGKCVYSSRTGWVSQRYRAVSYAGNTTDDDFATWLSTNCDITALSDISGTTWVFDDVLDYKNSLSDSTPFSYVENGITKTATNLNHGVSGGRSQMTYRLADNTQPYVYDGLKQNYWSQNGNFRAITYGDKSPKLTTIAFLLTVASKMAQIEYNGTVIGHMSQGQTATIKCRNHFMSGFLKVRSAYLCPCKIVYRYDCLAESTGRISINVDGALMRNNIVITT